MEMPDKGPQWLYRLSLCERLWVAENWTEDDRQIVQQHFMYLKDLTQQGTMILVGRTDVELRDNMGLAIFRAADELAAREIMSNDPCVIAGVMTAELSPFHVALLNTLLFSPAANS